MAAYLCNLNKAQKKAATSTEGSYMIIAGAGAGKTKVLTCRIAYLLQEKRVAPFQILALTFTNKAAKEMRQRIEEMVGNEAKRLWLGTFHSIFAKILRMEAEKLGYPPHFSIYDSTDSQSLLKAIIKEMDLEDKIYKPNVVLARISGAKNRLITAQMYANSAIYRAEDERANKPRMGEIFLKYTARCFQAGAMDFDDLLLNIHKLFSQHLEVHHKYQEQFRYILIDEFQDTNVAQYSIVKNLAAMHKNICVVGDDAQSIYSFRGANIQNMLSFEKDHPKLDLIKLEQNYRSTQNIVNAANSIISHNQAQLKKVVWTTNEIGETLSLIEATTEVEEGKLVATSIFEKKVNKQLSNNDFAILYRTNSQSRAIEEAFRKMNLPYRIIGGMSFYQRKEVKDLLAYLRFIVNHNDEEALKRIINLPKRGIGPASMEKIRDIAVDHAISLWEVLCHANHFLSGHIVHSMEAFVHMIQRIALAPQKNAYEIAYHIARESGLLKELYEDKTVEGLGRYENMQELLNGIKEFSTNPNNDDVSLGAFLQEVALVTSPDEGVNDDEAKVTLMTIHAAKGLEFAYVYIVGMEEDLFPSTMMVGSKEDLEEERRLFYVAVTRAKQKTFLSYALSRYRFGRSKQCEPSRFIKEIDPVYLQPSQPYLHDPTLSHPSTAYVHQRISRRRQHKPHQKLKPYTHVQPITGFQLMNIANLQAGMKVAHPTFGTGTILQLDGSSASKKAKVYFRDFGEKTLLLNFAKLKVLDIPSD